MKEKVPDEVRQDAPWVTMFADDIAMCSKSVEQVEEILERWSCTREKRNEGLSQQDRHKVRFHL